MISPPNHTPYSTLSLPFSPPHTLFHFSCNALFISLSYCLPSAILSLSLSTFDLSLISKPSMSMAAASLLQSSNSPIIIKLSPSPSQFPRYFLHKNVKNILFFTSKPSSYHLNFVPSLKCSSSSSSSSSVTTMEEEEMENLAPLSEIWKDIQGFNNWEGLLDPLNLHLRKEIIRYGEFSQACYDSFDFDPHSKYCGTCKYQASQFFNKLLMADRGYEITRYLYATSNINLPNFFQRSKMSSVWSPHANWMGYVAVATDSGEIRRLGRRDIVVAWRGTVTYLEWIHDLKDILRPAGFNPDDLSVKIESGFYDLYTMKEESCNYCGFSAREQILAELKRLVEQFCRLGGEEISITVTGHSLGAALALITAYDIAEMKLNVVAGGNGGHPTTVPVTVYSFSGPRVGNLKFKERCEDLGVKVLRVINVQDKVPMVPGIIANEKLQFQKYIEETMAFPWSYAHVGVELALDHTHSPFLMPTNDLGCAHNLEAHLHLVDGYHGKGRRFRLVTKRDIALVNKSCNFLKREYGVPPYWRQEENKGMVRNGEGRWVLPERPRVEAHPPETSHHLQQVLKVSAGGT